MKIRIIGLPDEVEHATTELSGVFDIVEISARQQPAIPRQERTGAALRRPPT